MPRGDGTGPGGMGRMTGGGFGYCAGGRGWARRWAPYRDPDPEAERQALRRRADALQTEIDAIRKRMEEN